MPMTRQDDFDRIRQNGDFDVLVIGGGINGLGVYRDLSLQGLRVLLVEKHDFCSGCSAAPSRMIHGGLRYLENGEFDLVRESLAERDALLRNAPHLVQPLPTTIPLTTHLSGLFNAAISFFGWAGRPAQRGALPVKVGLSLYDFVTRKRRQLPPHRFRSARATHRKWPDLMQDLRYSATYYDAWISMPERLGIELIRDTSHAAPHSIALNYAEARPIGDGFEICDRESGLSHAIRPKLIINASGAWLDEVRHSLAPPKPGNIGDRRPLVSGTKGSHLILEAPELFRALDGHMIFFENADGRVCIVFPYLGKVLAGSTDIRVDTVGRTRCEDSERDYILASLRRVFPNLALTPDQVVFSYSGIRPLPRSDQEFTGRISRGHFTHRIDGDIPQICMVGGKWTTFRAFAEQTADEALEVLGTARKCSTQDLPIGGGRDFPRDHATLAATLAQTFELGQERAHHLAQTYGTSAHELLRQYSLQSAPLPQDADQAVSSGEIDWFVTHEYARHLSDVVLRRTSLAITGRISLPMIQDIAMQMAKTLGWSGDTTQTEIETLITELHQYHGVSAEMLAQRSRPRSTQCA